MLTPEDKDWLRTEMENATLRGFATHKKEDHADLVTGTKHEILVEKVSNVSKSVWYGHGVIAAILAALGLSK